MGCGSKKSKRGQAALGKRSIQSFFQPTAPVAGAQPVLDTEELRVHLSVDPSTQRVRLYVSVSTDSVPIDLEPCGDAPVEAEPVEAEAVAGEASLLVRHAQQLLLRLIR